HRDGITKIIGTVCVTHDQVSTTGRLGATDERRAIPSARHMHTARAKSGSNGRATVSTAVVGYENFALEAIGFAHQPQRLAGGADARRQTSGLVEAGHDDRHTELCD